MKPTRITDAESLGKLIRARRKELGYTQQNLADGTRTSVRLISELERGKPTAQLGKVLKIFMSLSLDLNAYDRKIHYAS